MRKINQKIVEDFRIQLEKSNNILIVSHKNPDGDAIGSALGFLHFLNTLNKKANIIVPNNYPAFLKWLPLNDKILVFNENKEESIKLLNNADLLICLDFNDISRLGKMEPFVRNFTKPSVVIDHHPNPSKDFDIIISDIQASSTAELLFRLIFYLGKETSINKEMASCFYTGIMTDTGTFSYDSTGPDTFEIVSLLLKKGINKMKIHDEVYDNFSHERTKLFGYTLNEKLTVVEKYKTAYITLTKDDLKKFNHQSGDTEGFVNFPLSIKGILFSVIFIEHSDYIKVSLRSKADVPANKFAHRYFEGGGHKNAAGGQIIMSIEEIGQYFESLLPSFSIELGMQNNKTT